METNTVVKAEVDENGKDISQYCFSIALILRPIMEHFSTKELIRLSLVNKLWNFEARSVMRERGNLIAKFWYGGERVQHQDRCQQLVDFSSDLEKMLVIPFTGINFLMCHDDNCQSVSDVTLNLPYEVILDRVPWRHLLVTFYDDWARYKDCPALLLVTKILEDYCGKLEELTLGYGEEQFLAPFFQDRTFPRLKSLAVKSRESGSTNGYLSTSFIKVLVSSAPNLQELRVDEAVDLRVDILKESSSAVLVPEYRLCPLLKPICDGLIGSVRAHEMDIRIQRFDVNPQLLNRFIPKMLEASSSTLKTFSMDFLFALPLMCYGICLENVTTLEIHMNGYLLDSVLFEPSILMPPTGLDFTRVFPKLTQVTILESDQLDPYSGKVGAFIEQGHAVMRRALSDRATNIKLLKLDGSSSMKDFLPLLAHMFPDVKTVQFKKDHVCSFAQLRQHFLCLEDLHFLFCPRTSENGLLLR